MNLHLVFVHKQRTIKSCENNWSLPEKRRNEQYKDKCCIEWRWYVMFFKGALSNQFCDLFVFVCWKLFIDMVHIIENRFRLKSEYEITCDFDGIQKTLQSNKIKSTLFLFNQCNNIEVWHKVLFWDSLQMVHVYLQNIWFV